MTAKDWVLRGVVGLACAFLLFWSLVQASIKGPILNYDVAGYVGLALEWTVKDPVELHRQTFATLQAELSEVDFKRISEGAGRSSVRSIRYQDPQAFYEHLSFHRSRLVYSASVRLLHELLGVPLTKATYYVSRISWVLLALLLGAWGWRAVGFPLGLPAGVLVAHTNEIASQMSYSSPALQASLLACLGVFLLIEAKKEVLGAALMTAALFARLDTILLLAFLAPALWWLDPSWRPRTRFLGIWLGVSLALYFVIPRLTDAFGWWPFFWVYFHQTEPYPTKIPPGPQLSLYWHTLKLAFLEFPYPGSTVVRNGVAGTTLAVPMMAMSAVGAALARWSKHPDFARYQATFLALLAAFVVRWLLFPSFMHRFYTVLYVCLPFLMLSMLATLVRERAAKT